MTKIRYQSFYKGILYASHKNNILYKNKDDTIWKTYLTVDGMRKLNNLDLYNRLFREGIHNFYKMDDQFDIIILKGRIQFYKHKRLINMLIIENGSRPLRKGIVYKNGYIIYSEYHGNPNREPINIYIYDYINNIKETLYTFKSIRHIHFIQEDIYDSNIIYIGTGDNDNECGIYKFNLENRNIERIGGGSQIWRSVSIIQEGKSLYWGTDDPNGENFIIKYDLFNNMLHKIRKICGPAYYSVKTSSGEMYIATTIEDRKKHKSIIYKSSHSDRWVEYKEFKKDIFHTKYFGYGLIEFINNQETIREIYYNLIGLNFTV